MTTVLDLVAASQMMCQEIKTAQAGWSAGKIGTSEFNAIRWFLQKRKETKDPYPEWIIREMTKNAGFWNGYNITIHDALDDWSIKTLEAISQLDVAVAWNPAAPSQELELLNHFSPKSKKVVLRALEPYYTPQNQYTQTMTQGKIAVIGPFAKTIKAQWENMSRIFPNAGTAGPMWLPTQELVTINASYGPHMTSKDISKSWTPNIRNNGPNAALDYLEAEVLKSKAKYAFVGIGSLSLILISRLKKHGIIAIHTGGGTQIMFGVKGKRWSNHNIISKFFNQSWVNPLPEEIPSGADEVEGGCYW
jgi:hypothetical protein